MSFLINENGITVTSMGVVTTIQHEAVERA